MPTEELKRHLWPLVEAVGSRRRTGGRFFENRPCLSVTIQQSKPVIWQAIEANNEKLRKAGIQFTGSEKQIHVPEQKPQIMQSTPDNSN
jgi:hypothetical protein